LSLKACICTFVHSSKPPRSKLRGIVGGQDLIGGGCPQTPADLSGLPPARYLQWKAWLSSPISTTTPALESVTLSWDEADYTEVSGILSSDAAWTVADSPYLVTGNVLVGEGMTLTLEPGVTVWFSDTRALQVQGALVARGTATQPITFTSWHAQGQPDDWAGIVFGDTAVDATFDGEGNYLGGSALQYVTVEYARWGSFDYAVDAPDTAIYVDHCTIRYNRGGGLRVGDDGNNITHNTISHNGDWYLQWRLSHHHQRQHHQRQHRGRLWRRHIQRHQRRWHAHQRQYHQRQRCE